MSRINKENIYFCLLQANSLPVCIKENVSSNIMNGDTFDQNRLSDKTQ